MLLRIPDHANVLQVENLLSQKKAIEAPCNPSQYRILKRIVANPNNYLAIVFGAGSAPGLAGNLALAGFIQRMLNAMHRLEDQAWEYQAMKAMSASNCKFLVLNPHMKEGGAFDFSTIRSNYLWARKMFKEQLSNT